MNVLSRYSLLIRTEPSYSTDRNKKKGEGGGENEEREEEMLITGIENEFVGSLNAATRNEINFIWRIPSGKHPLLFPSNCSSRSVCILLIGAAFADIRGKLALLILIIYVYLSPLERYFIDVD